MAGSYFSTFSALALLSLATLSSAQSSPPPTPVGGPAFARTRTSFYIQGGNTDFRDPNPVRTGQFYRLDLSVPWNITQPAWHKLKDGPVNAVFPAVFSQDDKTMITFHSGISTTFAYKYSVDTDLWSPSMLRVGFPDFQGINAVTDPATGLVYLAAGYSSGARDSMDVYDFAIDDIRSSKLPPSNQVFEARAYYTNVWSKARGSALYFGGYNASLQPVANAVVSEYVPSTNSWSTLNTSGTGPSPRADHCMAVNDDGTKVIVFGGRLLTGNSGDIFILDLNTRIWTKGMNGPTRLYAACTIAGDVFILWGGTDGVQTAGFGTPSQPPLLYNITTDRWVTEYIPPSSYLAPNTGGGGDTDGGNSGGSSGKSNTGAIVGGIVAAVVVVAGIAGFLFMRRRKGAADKSGKTEGSGYSYSHIENNNHSGGLSGSHVAAPAPVPDSEAQIFNPAHSYQPPVLHNVPVSAPTSSSPYTAPITPPSVSATAYVGASTTAYYPQDPVKVMAVHTPEVTFPYQNVSPFVGSEGKDYYADGDNISKTDHPLSTLDADSSISRPGNPQAILQGTDDGRRGNPQAILEQHHQQQQ